MATFVNGQHRTDYGHIVLTTDNVLYPPEKIETTPSRADGLSAEEERDVRILGCDFIQASGLLLQLPQVAMATAQILFHRFYYAKSIIKLDYEHVVMAAIFLAAKVEECPRRIRDVLNCFHHIKQVKEKRKIQCMDFNGPLYFKLKNEVIKAERRLLKELGFCVHVKYPHKIIIVILKLFEQIQNQELTQLAWNFMNDSLKTDLFMRFTPDQIGCTCIWLAARQKKICLPKNPHWYELFSIKTEEIETIASVILELYILPRPDYSKLDTAINKAKEAFEKKKTSSDKNNKIPDLIHKTMSSFSPAVKDSLISPPKKSPTDHITKRISKLAENGKKKHHSPRRRYSPISPPRRKRSQDRERLNRRKKQSSNSSPSPSPPPHKHKDRRSSVSPPRRHKRRITVSRSDSDSDSSSGSSTTSEMLRAEERKRRHNEKKKLQEKKELQEQIRVLEKGRSKKHKNTHSQREYPKQSKHKVR